MPKVQSIEVDFPDEVLLKVALLAHDQDLTLNQFVSNILRDKLYEEKVRVLEQKVSLLEQAKAKYPEAFHEKVVARLAEEKGERVLKVGDKVRILPVPGDKAEYRPMVDQVGHVEDIRAAQDNYPFTHKVRKVWYRRDELELVE